VRLAQVAALGLVGTAVAGIGGAAAVAHGEQVPEGRFRFAVRLTMPDITRPDGSHYASACSAALVAPQWIVSAGHCFHDGARNRVSGPVRYQVIATLGTADLDSGHGIDVEIVEAQQSPTGSDVALGRLVHPVWGIPTIAVSGRAPQVGETVHIAGWGWTGVGQVAPSRILQTGGFTVRSVSDGVTGVVGLRPQADTSACVYDSGAPYFAVSHRAVRLVSVESEGPTCPHDQEETTARVDTLRSWVQETVHPAHHRSPDADPWPGPVAS
jgi:secreted trypsin-like serine protease